MNNPEFSSSREPSAEESADKFIGILDRLSQARQALLDRELPGVELSEHDKQELFRSFEARRAERIIQELELKSLGWFATPETSDVSASDLEATGDLLIDTGLKTIMRGESTSATSVSSSQIEIDRLYSINSMGRLSLHLKETREDYSLTGEPSVDEDMEEVIEGLGAPNRFQKSHPIKKQLLNDTEKEFSSAEAKLVVDDFNKLIASIIELYQNPALMINEDTYQSTEEHKKYVVEEIEDYE